MNQMASSVYEIRVEGLLDRSWSEWLEGWNIGHGQDGIAVLIGLVVDQAALYGLLVRLRGLNLPLVSVRRIDTRGDEM